MTSIVRPLVVSAALLVALVTAITPDAAVGATPRGAPERRDLAPRTDRGVSGRAYVALSGAGEIAVLDSTTL